MNDHSPNVLAEVRFSLEKMQKVNLFETSNFFCDVYGFEPGQEQKVHSHAAADKVYLVLDGRGTFTVADKSCVLGPNQMVCVPAGAPHGVLNTSDSRLSVLVFMTPNPNK